MEPVVQLLCTVYEHSKSRHYCRVSQLSAGKSDAKLHELAIDTLDSRTLRTRVRTRGALGGLREPHRRLRAAGRPSKPPTGKVVGQPQNRGSCRTGPLRGERCDRSPRGGSPGHRCPISLLHIGSLHNAITASSSTRSSATSDERANAKGQPHSAAAHTQATAPTPGQPRTRWREATRPRAAAASGKESRSATPSTSR